MDKNKLKMLIIYFLSTKRFHHGGDKSKDALFRLATLTPRASPLNWLDPLSQSTISPPPPTLQTDRQTQQSEMTLFMALDSGDLYRRIKTRRRFREAVIHSFSSLLWFRVSVAVTLQM
jgi:hypothetical protein